MAIEEPKYTISEKESPFEVRRYDPILIAEVFVEGSRDEASNKGFRMIADFIFGNNEGLQKESQKIAMTAPVVVEPNIDSKKIALVNDNDFQINDKTDPKTGLTPFNTAPNEMLILEFADSIKK